MSARTRPSALCSECQAYNYDKNVIDKPCNAPESQPRCNGVWKDRTRLSDWITCRICSGTGYVNSKRCPDCKHSGWIPHR